MSRNRIYTLQTDVCNTSMSRVFDYIKNKTIDTLKIPLLDVNTNIVNVPNDWYREIISIPPSIVTNLVYLDNSDPLYLYIITIMVQNSGQSCCNSNPVSDCVCLSYDCISTETSDNNLNFIGDSIPFNIIDNAMNKLPIKCGTGIWDGCTSGVQNKYIIIGAVGIGALSLFI